MNFEQVIAWIQKYPIINEIALFLGILLTSYLSLILVRRYVYKWIKKTVRKTKFQWDDILLKEGVFKILIALVPVLVIYYGIRFFPSVSTPIGRVIRAYIYLHLTYFLVRLLSAGLTIYESSHLAKKKPIKGYVQMVNIFLYIIGGIVSLSILIDESPWYFLSSIGALTAVMLLVFRDTILSFMASLQISSYDLVRVGDWIEMSKYGADGDVIEIALHTVKVQNWDKTITLIPTYKLIEDSFKNWRGMTQSKGRRIKRGIFIDQNTIRFCDEALLENIGKIQILQAYLNERKADIEQYNREHNVDFSHVLNGRKMTNIGVFRAYIIAYLQNHPQIHKEMTFLVRQLAVTPYGLPLEIYVFSNDIVWANYERIQADIFDHLVTATREFDLRLFQNPSGNDIAHILKTRDI